MNGWQIVDGRAVFLTGSGDGVELEEVYDSRTPIQLAYAARESLHSLIRAARPASSTPTDERMTDLAFIRCHRVDFHDAHPHAGRTCPGVRPFALRSHADPHPCVCGRERNEHDYEGRDADGHDQWGPCPDSDCTDYEAAP